MHMKRVTSPKFWKAGRKNKVWIFTPRPGPHPKRFCFPLSVLLRDVMGIVSDAREARAAIKNREVLVDGVPRTDTNFPVGVMDVISIPSMKQDFRIVPYKKGLKVIEIPKTEAKTKLLKVIRKQMVAGKIQITTHDGRNFLDVKGAKPGDTVVVEFDKDGKPKPKAVLEFKEGHMLLVFRGKQAGRMGKFDSANTTVIMKASGSQTFEAPKDYVMVVGKTKPEIKLDSEGE